MDRPDSVFKSPTPLPLIELDTTFLHIGIVENTLLVNWDKTLVDKFRHENAESIIHIHSYMENCLNQFMADLLGGRQ